ncbi:UDP-N-acetylmuramate--L-alanine ligase [Candidatus Gracilibacteria bacterium]|nr:UDP-N-acetylmuramate--L-alanine ligase [Candidatus Gracilibacteria bacterium]
MNKKIFFIGIGGIGMSALARFYKAKGFEVAGSDAEKTSITEELISEGIDVKIGHCPENITGNEEKIFYTEAISEKNIEFQKAKKLKLNLKTYFEGVGEISKKYKTIAVAGAHGKSTTTAMIAILLQELGLSPSCIVGTKVPNFGNKNFLVGDGEFLIVEACEYRESFLDLEIFGEVILNIEAEHLDYYGTEEKYFEAFKKFYKKIPKNGFLIWNKNCKNSKKIFGEEEKKIKELEKKFIQNEKNFEEGKKFLEKKITGIKGDLKKIPDFQIPGNHIKFDVLCAVKAVEKILLSMDRNEENLKKIFKIFGENKIREKHFFEGKKFFCGRGLKNKNFKILQKKFSGTWRRFEILGKVGKSTIISDYAHHPAEIIATLKSAKLKFPNQKIITIFEPHQYSRTIELFDDFCKSFGDADLVIIPSIYKVRDKDEDVKKMSPKQLADGILEISGNSKFLDGYNETEKFLRENFENDENILIFMGAGDIDNLARKFIGK